MELNGKNMFFLCAGSIGGACVLVTFLHLRKVLKKSCTTITMEKLTDRITLSNLRELTQGSDASIRQFARNIVIYRVLKPQNMKFVVQCCYYDDEMTVLKACTILENFAKSPELRSNIIQFGGLEALSHAFYRSWVKKTSIVHDWSCKIQQLISVAIFDLISDDDRTNINNTDVKIRLLEKNPSLIPTVLGIMEGTENREVEKWCLYLIHQIAVCESTREKLKDHWLVVEAVSKFVVKNHGDYMRLKFGYHILVTLANVLFADNEVMVLEVIRDCGVARTAVGCLKSDNDELVYWVVGLIHEFAISDVAIAELVEIPVLCKYLYSAMVSSEASLQRLIVRVLRYLSENSHKFKMSVIHHKQLLARLPVCLVSGDDDLASWSLFLVHDIAKTGDAAIELLFEHSKGVIEALVQLSSKNTQDTNTTCRYIAETLGFFCSMESIHCDVVKAGALKAILKFAMMDDIDIKFWSTSLLLNLSMSMDLLKEQMVKERGVGVLIDLAVSDTDEPQVAMQAAKTLIMLGFIDTPFRVYLKSSGYKTPCSILINDVEYSSNELGINMVVVDPMNLEVVENKVFNTGHNTEASTQLIDFLTTLPLMSLVFIVVKGEANYFLTDDAKKALCKIGINNYNHDTGELWLFSGQKRYDFSNETNYDIKLVHGYDDIDFVFDVPQGYFVNKQVEALIMAPLLDILMSTPPESGISKVSELELLTILARHNSHRKAILQKEGFLDYMKKLIWNMASRSLNDLRSNPMLVAHCIGAMKTICGLILSDEAAQKCFQVGVVQEIFRLLILINSTTFKANSGRKSGFETGSVTDFDNSFTSVCASESIEKEPFSSANDNSPYKNNLATLKTENRELPIDYTGFEEAFDSLTQLSVTILYHCCEALPAQDSVHSALCVHVLWCTLRLCKNEFMETLAIPIENIISRCASQECVLALDPDNTPVSLDHNGKTEALMLSSDHFDVVNFNWTFESIHATHSVGRSKYNHGYEPAGWYYEVQIKSCGIMQIGWRTELCDYGPEKGVGVGDNEHSCAIDGARMKIWNGPMCKQKENDYGKEWVIDDIVSCLFSLNGEVSFWLNGEDLGVAFDHMNTELDYYPGVSLAMDQHCSFNFGGDKAFRFQMPEGYVAVNDVVDKRLCPKRPRSKSYTKGSFESIAEVDEENLDDVKNIHLSRLQRCSSSEPSLRESEKRQGSVETQGAIKRRSSASYNDSLSTTPIKSNLPSTPSAVFTPVTPLSPFWSPVFTRQNSDFPPTLPCLYFEVDVNTSCYRARRVGYFSRKTGKYTACEFHENQNMSFPSGDANSSVKAPSVIGCGLLLPDGIFFTLDGVFNNIFFELPDEKPEIGDLLPYITCSMARKNFGQQPFLFQQANIGRERLAAVEMLHIFSNHLFNQLT